MYLHMQGERDVRQGVPLSSDLILCPTHTSVPSSVCVESESRGKKVGFPKPNSALLPLLACFFCVIMSTASGGKKIHSQIPSLSIPSISSVFFLLFLKCP